MSYDYKISIVMAVYNVELFLPEAIESIIKQDIGFENVQLILVNDGSKDNSGEICDKYGKLYPNITVLHKENGGVSSARNLGIKYVKGRYVNFLDSDDKLSESTLKDVYNFFEKNNDLTDIVSIPIKYFEGQTGNHLLNDKFRKGQRVIDLNTEWNYCQLSSASAFIKSECFKDVSFDENLAYAEDAQILQIILSKKCTLGVVPSGTYWYRKRKSGESSALQVAFNRREFYLPCIKLYHEYIVDYCNKNYAGVPKFIQYALLYELQWRLRRFDVPEGVLSEDEINEYRKRIFALLKFFDDDVIYVQNSLPLENKMYLLHKKHECKPTVLLNECKASITYNNRDFYKINLLKTYIDSIDINDEYLYIEGRYLQFDMDDFKVDLKFLINESTLIDVETTDYTQEIRSIGEVIAVRKGFRVKLPIGDHTTVKVCCYYENDIIHNKDIFWGTYSPINSTVDNTYWYKNRKIVRINDGTITIDKSGKLAVIKQEFKYIKSLLKSKRSEQKKAAAVRIIYHMIKPLAHKNIWLISDKADRADDNGEAFFIYLSQIKKKSCYPIFLIGKDSPDYIKMKKYGKVVPYMSWQHKILHLLAKKSISAYSHTEISTPFFERTKYYSNLMQDNKIVFLQHGIIKDDLSRQLNKKTKNYSLFVTSTEKEKSSILEYNYGYSEDEVILTGLPRYDRLYNNPKKMITIMPTWARHLVSTYNPQTSKWDLIEGFEQSDYYKFYDSLLNSEKLLKHATEKNYNIAFLIHPVFFDHINRFKINDKVKVFDRSVVYRDVFAESSLVITDYSSAVFDFAYLRKPVLYAHFEKNHYEKGYFDYERDGFGEIEYTVEEIVDSIIEYINNDCVMKKMYRDRVDNFYAFNDRNNCQRVYEKILELDKEK